MGNTEIRLNPDKVQAIIDDLTKFRNEKIDAGAAKVTETNDDVSKPFDLNGFKTNVAGHSENLKDRIADLQTCLDAAKAANDCGITTKNPDGTIAYVVTDGHAETVENVKSDNHVEDWRAAKKDAADLTEMTNAKSANHDKYQELLSRIQQKQDNPYYAASFVGAIGMERLLDLPLDAQKPYDVYDAKDRTKGSFYPDVGSSLAQTFGHLLSAASSTWSDSTAENNAKLLAAYANQDGHENRIGALNTILGVSRNVDIDGDGGTETVGLPYNEAFLLPLAYAVEHFDKKTIDSNSRNPNAGTNGNPLAGIVHTMTGNPEASAKWLTMAKSDGELDLSSGSSQAEALVERMRKLAGADGIGNNVWTDDWTRIANTAAMRDQPPGSKNREVLVASGVLNGIGLAEKPGDVSAESRGRLANVLAHYPAGVDESAQSGNPGWTKMFANQGATAGMGTQPVFSDKSLSYILGQVMQDGKDTAKVKASLEDFNTKRVTEAAESYNETKNPTDLQLALKRQSATNGFFTGAADHWAYKNGASADQMVEGASKIGFTAASMIPGVGTAVGPARTIYDLVKDDAGWTSNAVRSGQKSSDHQTADRETNRQQMVVALASTGLYSEEDWKSISEHLTDEEARSMATPNGMSGMSATDLRNKGGALNDIGDHLNYSNQSGLNGLDLSKDGDLDSSYDGGYKAANPNTNSGTDPQGELDRNVKYPNQRVGPRKAPYDDLPEPNGKQSHVAKPGANNPG
jgi:hypothetical protein